MRNDRRGERLRAAGNFRATTGIGAAEEIVRGHRRDGIACTEMASLLRRCTDYSFVNHCAPRNSSTQITYAH